MEALGQSHEGVAVIAIIVTVIAGIIAYFAFSKPEPKKAVDQPIPEKPKGKEVSGKKEKKQITKEKVERVQDPLYLFEFKGHSKVLTAVLLSPDGKSVATTSEDRILKIHPMDIVHDRSINPIRVNLPLDHATAAAFTADGHHVLLAMSNNQEILAYQIGSKKGENGKQYKEVHRFPTTHKTNIHALEVTPNSKFVMTATLDDNDTTIYLWSLKGQPLDAVNTNQVKINMITFSPDSKFFSAACWTGDVRLWEIKTKREDGSFDKVVKAMELKGHRSTVYCVAYSGDAKHVVTTSKDGTWKYWNIAVRYEANQDPECLLTVPAPDGKIMNLCSISRDGKTIVIISGNHMYFYDTSGKLVHEMDASFDGSIILNIAWTPDSRAFLVGSNYSGILYKNPHA